MLDWWHYWLHTSVGFVELAAAPSYAAKVWAGLRTRVWLLQVFNAKAGPNQLFGNSFRSVFDERVSIWREKGTLRLGFSLFVRPTLRQPCSVVLSTTKIFQKCLTNQKLINIYLYLPNYYSIFVFVQKQCSNLIYRQRIKVKLFLLKKVLTIKYPLETWQIFTQISINIFN